MSDPSERRQSALRALLATHGVDALVVASLPNIRYLIGFTGSAGILIVAPRRSILVTDFRYATQAPAEVGREVDVRIERTSVWEGVRQTLATLEVSEVAVERDRTTLGDLEQLRQTSGVEFRPFAGLVEQLRVSKDASEIGAIREAAALGADALAATLSIIRPGLTELEVAAELEAQLRRRGSEWHPFQSIVAAGPRSALPHARSSTRPIERGDLLVIDFGAQIRGYCSDVTRTVVVGALADERQASLYDLVRRAQLRARSGLRAGLTGREADSLARDLIAREGAGEAFGHSLGHGLGLEVHEAPRLSQSNDQPLPAGAVVTVEPGVYFEGWGGIRIEDDVVLGPDSAECLSDGRTDLVELT
jgi:Xaa-Pro aminopeptidase